MQTGGGCMLGGTRPVSNTIHEPSVRVAGIPATRTLVKRKNPSCPVGGDNQAGRAFLLLHKSCKKSSRNFVLLYLNLYPLLAQAYIHMRLALCYPNCEATTGFD